MKADLPTGTLEGFLAQGYLRNCLKEALRKGVAKDRDELTI